MSSSIQAFNNPCPHPRPVSGSGSECSCGFLKTWLNEQEHDLADLKAARKTCTESTQPLTELTQSFTELVDRVLSHYDNHYRLKSECVDRNFLRVLTPSSRSKLEEAFIWIGGWRPSTAFHLLYSLTGLELEAGLSEFLRRFNAGELGCLSPSQLTRINELQGETIKEERIVTEKLASHQETVADSAMVKLSRDATELKDDPNPDRVRVDSMKERVKSTLDSKEDRFKEIYRMADDLRLRTLRNVAGILSPIQAVHFLIAAVELHLRVHEWGMNRDADVDQQ